MQPIILNALVFQEEGMWVAQCLEHDLVSCAETLQELPATLERQVRDVVAADLAAGQQPFAAFKPAPSRFWTLFDSVKRSRPLTSPGMLDRVLEIPGADARVEAHLFNAPKAA